MLQAGETLYLIDGNNLAYRSQCVFKDLTVDSGDGVRPIGAIYGTVTILGNILKGYLPGKILMPFDNGPSKYRKQLFPEYKANRGGNPFSQKIRSDLGQQMDHLQELLPMLGVLTLRDQHPGWEADDIIAYLCSRYTAGAFPNIKRILIFSSDRDLCQLVTPTIHWYDPVNKKMVTPDTFTSHLPVPLSQFVDYKSLAGDKSDNIPNPAGLGEKTAQKLLSEYQDLDTLIKIKHDKLKGEYDMVLRNRQLVKLDLHERFPEDPCWKLVDAKIQESCSISPNIQEVFELLQFDSLLQTWEEMRPRWEQFAGATL